MRTPVVRFDGPITQEIAVDDEGKTSLFERKLPPIFLGLDRQAAIETDAAARALLLWGRRPADPSRWRSDVGPEALRRVRSLLRGY